MGYFPIEPGIDVSTPLALATLTPFIFRLASPDVVGITGASVTNSQGVGFAIPSYVIIAINGSRVVNGDDLSTYLEENTLPNQTILITILRNGQTMDLSVVPYLYFNRNF
jgi:hypothetical protein